MSAARFALAGVAATLVHLAVAACVRPGAEVLVPDPSVFVALAAVLMLPAREAVLAAAVVGLARDAWWPDPPGLHACALALAVWPATALRRAWDVSPFPVRLGLAAIVAVLYAAAVCLGRAVAGEWTGPAALPAAALGAAISAVLAPAGATVCAGLPPLARLARRAGLAGA